MKKKKKRIFSSVILTTACVSVLTLSSVQAYADSYKEEQIRQTAASMLMACMTTDEQQYQALQELRSDKLDFLLMQSAIPCEAEDYLSILTSWRDGIR